MAQVGRHHLSARARTLPGRPYPSSPVAMVLPGFTILPLWIIIAIAFPLLQTFHALQNKSDDRKVWLVYWGGYMACSLFLLHFEWAIYLPFSILDSSARSSSTSATLPSLASTFPQR